MPVQIQRQSGCFVMQREQIAALAAMTKGVGSGVNAARTVMLRGVAISKTELTIANQCLEWTRRLKLEQQSARL